MILYFHSVVHHLAFHGDAVGWAGGGALAADLAEVFDPDVERLVRDQRHIGEDGVPQMDSGAEFFSNEHAIPAQLPDTGGQGGWHALDAILDGFVAQLANVRGHVGVDEV